MRKGNIILWMILLGMVGVSCSDGDDVATTPPEKVLTCDFIFSIRQPGGMRMANEVVQTEESMFRGLQNVQVIPFTTVGAAAVGADDEPQEKTTLFTNENRVTGRYYYYIENCRIANGTNRMLAYGQAAPVTGRTSEKENGKLVNNLAEVITNSAKPSAINFQLQEIHSSTEVASKYGAQALASYLTDIANTNGWSTTADAELQQLYRDFIRAGQESTGLLAGSTASVKGHVEALETALSGKSDALSTAIKANITAGESVLTAPAPDYPANIGLPDGAVALRWTGTGLGNQFSVRTAWTTLDNINSINRFTYPAELWYYVNSAIKTSNQKVGRESYEAAGTWGSLLNSYLDGTAVDNQTMSVAVTAPLQYGVGRLQLTLKKIVGTLKDANGEDVTGGTAANLPLKGVIVTGQHPVGFDFKPKTPEDDGNARFIYDPVVGTTGTGADETVNTLVLQSYDGEKVYVVLEMQNDTGHAFHGKDAVIYPGSKFYLVAQLDPAGLGADDYAGRVFTQDYYTKVDVTVNSLAKAYSCIPDLLEPRLEIGVLVETKWIQSTTTTVKL